MAEDKDRKTQKPTAQKLRKARQKGQVARSREVVGIAVFIAALLVIHYQGSFIFDGLKSIMSNVFSMRYGKAPLDVMRAASFDGLRLLAPIFLAAMVIAIGSTVAQGGFVMRPFELNFGAINPMGGLAKKFSAQGLHDTYKSLLKFISGSIIFYFVLRKMIPEMPQLMTMGLTAMMIKAYTLVVQIVKIGVLWLFLIAAVSYFLDRKQFNENMMMTKEDVKEEHKETDGDPKVKQRIRTIQFQMARKRMLQAVPQATVVITNPTHFAVALLYEKGMGAPKIVAKGADHIAFRIREIAKQSGVPIIEDKPLARTLYKLELDSFIPQDLYKAVAKIIASVLKLKGKAA